MKKYIKATTFILPIALSGCYHLDFSRHTKCNHVPLPKYKNINTALVLSGGGVKGLAHIAVLEELENAGIKPDLIVGCSAGAIVGALYADGADLEEHRNSLLAQKNTDFVDIAYGSLTFGISRGFALRQFLNDRLKSKRLEDMPMPFVAVATNLEFGDLVAFGKGPIDDAVLASAAFPGAYHPVKVNGQYYVDGGVADPCPVGVARKLGAKHVIAVDLAGDISDLPPSHLFGVVKRSLEISYIHHSKMAVKDADYVVRIPFKGIDTFDDSCKEDVYRLGKATFKASIADLKKALKVKN